MTWGDLYSRIKPGCQQCVRVRTVRRASALHVLRDEVMCSELLSRQDTCAQREGCVASMLSVILRE